MSREFSRIKTTIWHSKKFNALLERHRLFYLYLLTCKQANAAGLFTHQIGYMMVDMGWSEKDCKAALEAVEKVGLINYDFSENNLFIHAWLDVNPPQNPKHAIKIISDTLSIPDGKLKVLCFADISKALQGKDWTLNEKTRSELDRVSSFGRTTHKQYNNNNNIREQEKSDHQIGLFHEIGKSPGEEPQPASNGHDQAAVLDPVKAAFDLYNETAKKLELPVAKSLTDDRKKKLRVRLEDDQDLTNWKTALANIARSPFLTGKNDRGWKASLDFLLQPSSYSKVLEGVYSGKINGHALPDPDKDFSQMTKEERLASGFKYDNETFTWYDQHGEVIEEPAL